MLCPFLIVFLSSNIIVEDFICCIDRFEFFWVCVFFSTIRMKAFCERELDCSNHFPRNIRQDTQIRVIVFFDIHS